MNPHKLVSGDIYKHRGAYYLAIETNVGFRSFFWTGARVGRTLHWWERDPDNAEYIMNIASCLYDVFYKLENI